jgi:phosphatidylglycerophosphate synthase
VNFAFPFRRGKENSLFQQGEIMQVLTNVLHRREQSGLLADCERTVLEAMAVKLPRWIHSDHLTLLGLLSMIAAGLALWAARTHRPMLFMVVIALALNWFGDSLDGTLARVRNRQRPRYGFYVDHVIDLFGTFFLLGGLALSGIMTPLVALGQLIAFLMVQSEVYLATHVCGVFRMAFLRIGPTELRILLAAGVIAAYFHPRVQLADMGQFLLFDVGGVMAIFGMALAFVVSSIRNTAALYRAERLS